MIAFNLSDANNINMHDIESWPLPDVFPQQGEYTLDRFAEFVAAKFAYFNVGLPFSESKELHQKLNHHFFDEAKRKLGWEEEITWLMDLYHFPFLDTVS
jgi:hypothetical protein